jgi:hypothetical protein
VNFRDIGEIEIDDENEISPRKMGKAKTWLMEIEQIQNTQIKIESVLL